MENYQQFKVLSWAFSFLKEHGREEQVAEILLQHYLAVDRSTFYLHMREQVPLDVWQAFKLDIEKHAQTGVPVQHLVGHEYFFGRKFHVNEQVLIPRMETEELVLYVMNQVKQQTNMEDITIVDVGTGSGVIAVPLAKELTDVQIYARAISENALQIAREHARRHQANVSFLQGNFLQPIIDQKLEPNVIVANPPYISKEEAASLIDTVKDYDPALALFADEEGLAAYKEILQQIERHLFTVNHIFFEIGYEQKAAITKLASIYFPESTITCLQDINGNDRIIAISL